MRSFRRSPKATVATTQAAARETAHRRGVRETARAVRPSPPWSHSYQP
ncbi:MAG: hypothetical protein U0599_06180 [Vicinamibacteria bacterium]